MHFDNRKLFLVKILQDFKRKYPASDPAALNKKFLSKFSSSLVKLAKRKGESIPKCSEECLRSLVLTLQLLPSVNNVKKASFDSKLGRLFLFVKENECISTLAEKKDSTYHKQPFLVVTGTMEHPISFNLEIDKTVIPLGYSDIIRSRRNRFHCVLSLIENKSDEDSTGFTASTNLLITFTPNKLATGWAEQQESKGSIQRATHVPPSVN
ncbi:hypothetical protein OUZ56_017556 [Daphnia magna]|uniref:Uncharacterized protein n=1 Tax=Daphnia magna TaxID=35525 RepID=A0ABR0AT36_9CRUS|nr:hypothetical protein OUZ56_017556 [Daphnia magna]